jgi:phospholipid/cholesterol/gamma-HCH transport system substrate-binding protein
MAKDDSLYHNLNQTAANLNALIKDMKEHPGRYINISVFGKNNK